MKGKEGRKEERGVMEVEREEQNMEMEGRESKQAVGFEFLYLINEGC